MNGGFQNRRSLYIEGQQGGEKGVLVAPCLIDGGDQHPLNLDFLRGAGIAKQPGIFNSANTQPDDGHGSTFLTNFSEDLVINPVSTAKSPALGHLGIPGYTHLPAHTFCQLFLQS